MDVNQAIGFAEVLNQAYTVPPTDVTNAAGTTFTTGGRTYAVVTTIYANDLSTDMNPVRGVDIVSIGLIVQAVGTGDVVVAIRGTEGIFEWIHDLEFGQVPCPILPGSGKTEDGFTAMYTSLRLDPNPNSPSAAAGLAALKYPQPPTSMTICGHSLGGALATLLGLDVAANTVFKAPAVYTYASPRTGDANFAATYNQVVKNSSRIANRIDIVPKLPLPPLYLHVNEEFDLNPIQIIPPKILVVPSLPCEHALNTYLFLLSLKSGGAVIPLDSACSP